MNNRKLLPLILLIALSLIWGSSFILMKRGLLVFSAHEVALIRVITAFLFLLPFSLMRLHKLAFYDHVKLIISGLMGIFIPAFLFAMAQTRLDSAITGVMNSLTPTWAAIIGAWVSAQPLTRYALIGIFMGIIGVIMLISPNLQSVSEVSGTHALMLVGATFLYGCNLNFVKYKMKGINALTITSVSLFIIGLLSTIYLFSFTEFTSKLMTYKKAWQSLVAVMVLGLMGTAIAVIVLNYLVKITTPLYASLVTYLIPLVAITLGVLDGEHLSINFLFGAIAIVCGVYLSNKKGKSPPD